MKIRAIRFRRPKTSKEQVFAVVGVHLMLFSTLSSLPLIEWLTARHYKLDAQTLSLVGEASPKLAHKLIYNKEKAIYEYNTDDIKREDEDPAAIAQRLQRNMTGENADKSTYSLELSADTANGMTIYDNNSGISFKMVPEFTTMPGRKEQDRLVYPMQDGSKAIYTIKNNGLKEDIVYQTAPKGGKVALSYKLELPDSLEAKLASDGSVGFYSADPLLFGQISFGSDADQEKVESARKNAPKDHLVFAIPAPVIVAADGKIGEAETQFELSGDTLSVVSTKLDTIKGAFSIDPTVVVTSTSDFTAGNNEGNINFASNEIKRTGYTGGETASWTSSTSMTQNRSDAKAVAYNGYMYILGGSVAPAFSTDLNTVIYSPIDPTTGALGAWTESPNAFTNARYYFAAAAYNGYLYVSGGRNGAGARFNDVQYSKINTDGSIGAWTAASTLPSNRTGGELVAVDNYLYFLGGYDGTTYYATAHYAAINANGSIGAWTATTSFTTGRYSFGATHYNGYIYIMGGVISGGSTATVYYAKVKTDGTLGAWQAGTSAIQTISNAPFVALDGYLYTYGGLGPGNGTLATTAYVPINANGSIGSWVQAANTYTTPRVSHVGVAYNGKLYLAGGNSTTNYTPTNDSQYVSIQPAGAVGPFASTTAMPTFFSQGKDYGRANHATVVYNGYIYVIGGVQKGAQVATVDYAVINSNGTVGAWAATSSMVTARTLHAAVAYNGQIYVLGGVATGSVYLSSVERVGINANGTLATWVAATGMPETRYLSTAEAYNGYVYVFGGSGSAVNSVRYNTINLDGTLGTTWTATTNLPASRYGHTSAVFNGYVYLFGGSAGATTYANDVLYAPINANGTIGTWQYTYNSASSGSFVGGFTTGRRYHSGGIYNGTLYVAGGTNGTQQNDVQYATLNTDGTIGTWSTARSFSTARDGHGSVVYNGYLYVVGGSDATAIERSDVQYTLINNGGPGTTDAWSNTTAFTTARQDHTSIVANGYLYVMGGSSGTTYYNDVQYAPLNADGTVGTWQATNSFATARAAHTSVVSNGYVYILGGCTGTSTVTASTQYAQLNANGTVGTWSSTTALPQARCEQAAAAYNGYVYIMGGKDSSTVVSGVYRSTINTSTGALGNWTGMNALNNVRMSSPGAVVYNGYLYVAGGETYNSPEYYRSVEFAKINADGTLGTWMFTSELPERRDRPGIAVANGRLYLTGGNTGSGNASTTYYAPFVGPNGHLGTWEKTGSTFINARLRHESVIHNGYLYVIGGYSGGVLSDVQYTGVATMPRIASYSRLVDLGSVVTVNSITSNGSGTRSVAYRSAGSDGVFGAEQPAGSTGGVSARYVWVKARFDDSDTLLATPAAAVMNDVTVDYGAGGAPTCTTAQRLRHGSYFSTEVLQPLNTCLP